MHKENDKHIVVRFVSLIAILSDVGGFAKSVTTIFLFLFGPYIYNLFIKDLSKIIYEKSIEKENNSGKVAVRNDTDKKVQETQIMDNIKHRLSFMSIYDLFDNVETEMIKMKKDRETKEN